MGRRANVATAAARPVTDAEAMRPASEEPAVSVEKGAEKIRGKAATPDIVAQLAPRWLSGNHGSAVEQARAQTEV